MKQLECICLDDDLDLLYQNVFYNQFSKYCYDALWLLWAQCITNIFSMVIAKLEIKHQECQNKSEISIVFRAMMQVKPILVLSQI